MTATYRWVQWNTHKKLYDGAVALAAALYVATFMGVSLALFQPPNDVSPPVLLMRALGTLGIVLLHVILCIGPLARLSDRFAPLLYNRRHLGVTFFLVAFLHGLVAVGFYGGFGVRDPLTSVIAGYDGFGSISSFPFEFLGFAALLIFFVMAATSHDVWLKQLGPRAWKTLHTAVYVAYGLVVLHVALGPLQSERHPLLAALLVSGVLLVGALHVAAAMRQLKRIRAAEHDATTDGWIDAGPIDDIGDHAARTIRAPSGASIALFRVGDGVHALSNVCAHQGGPLGEGRVIDGCATCPWHGYQYRPHDGTSPPPYDEKLPTFTTKVVGRRVFVDPKPNPPGVPVTPHTAVDPSDDSAPNDRVNLRQETPHG